MYERSPVFVGSRSRCLREPSKGSRLVRPAIRANKIAKVVQLMYIGERKEDAIKTRAKKARLAN